MRYHFISMNIIIMCIYMYNFYDRKVQRKNIPTLILWPSFCKERPLGNLKCKFGSKVFRSA